MYWIRAFDSFGVRNATVAWITAIAKIAIVATVKIRKIRAKTFAVDFEPVARLRAIAACLSSFVYFDLALAIRKTKMRQKCHFKAFGWRQA